MTIKTVQIGKTLISVSLIVTHVLHINLIGERNGIVNQLNHIVLVLLNHNLKQIWNRVVLVLVILNNVRKMHITDQLLERKLQTES